MDNEKKQDNIGDSGELLSFVKLAAQKLGFGFKHIKDRIYEADLTANTFKHRKGFKNGHYRLNFAESRDENDGEDIFEYIAQGGKKQDFEYVNHNTDFIQNLERAIFDHYSYLKFSVEDIDKNGIADFSLPKCADGYSVIADKVSRSSKNNTHVYEIKIEVTCTGKVRGILHKEPCIESVFFDLKNNILEDGAAKYKKLLDEGRDKYNGTTAKPDPMSAAEKNAMTVAVNRMYERACNYLKHARTGAVAEYIKGVDKSFWAEISERGAGLSDESYSAVESALVDEYKVQIDCKFLGVYKIQIPRVCDTYKLCYSGETDGVEFSLFRELHAPVEHFYCPHCNPDDVPHDYFPPLKISKFGESLAVGCEECVTHKCAIVGCKTEWFGIENGEECISECSACGNSVCAEHLVQCSEPGCNETVCLDCAAVIPDGTEYKNVSYGGRKYCAEHVVTCSASGEIIPKSIARKSSLSATKYYHADYIVKCSDCGKEYFYRSGDSNSELTVGTQGALERDNVYLCASCRTTCDGCGAVISHKKAKTCGECGEALCSYCCERPRYDNVRNVINATHVSPRSGRFMHERCTARCGETGLTIGKSEFVTCDTCGKSYAPSYFSGTTCNRCTEAKNKALKPASKLTPQEKCENLDNKNKLSIFARLFKKVTIVDNNGSILYCVGKVNSRKPPKYYVADKVTHKITRVKGGKL